MRISAIVVALTIAFATPVSAADSASVADAAGHGIGVVPFHNMAGAPDALAVTMPEVVRLLERSGFSVIAGDAVRSYLRAHRIRARHEMSREHVQALAAELGVRYLALGSVDVWAQNGGPEIGLSARILDTVTGRSVWAGSAEVHAVDVPGLLALRRPDTMEQASRKATRELFASLSVKRRDGGVVKGKPSRRPRKSALTDAPIVFRKPTFDPNAPLRIAVLPLTNRSLSSDAPGIVNEQLLGWLLNVRNIEVVDPGELRRVLVENDIQPLYGMDSIQLHMMQRVLNADALLDGTILVFTGGAGRVPDIDIYVRLRDTSTGETLWAATTTRAGDQSRTFYDLGRIQSVDRLAQAALGDLLSTLLR